MTLISVRCKFVISIYVKISILHIAYYFDSDDESSSALILSAVSIFCISFKTLIKSFRSAGWSARFRHNVRILNVFSYVLAWWSVMISLRSLQGRFNFIPKRNRQLLSNSWATISKHFWYLSVSVLKKCMTINETLIIVYWHSKLTDTYCNLWKSIFGLMIYLTAKTCISL